jgi:flagellar assembly factor FliW
VLVTSDRFGALDVEEDRVLQFPDGLLGFPSSHRFALIDSADTGVYFWLQSIDDPSLAFLSVVPFAFFPDYQLDLSADDEQAMGLISPSDALVLCLLTVLRPENPVTENQVAANQITANLLGPIVINSVSRVGRQIILADSGYPVRAPLAA